MLNQSYAFGVDIGGTSVKMGLFSVESGLLEKWQIPSHTDGDSAAMLAEIADSILKKTAEKGITPADVCGVGVGAPGPVDAQGVVHGCVNLGWGEVALKTDLEALCGFVVRAENDANVAALGELWQGSAKDCDSMVLLTLGTGVGGAVILGGRLLKGAHGCAGEVGHIAVCPDETVPCSCGRRGCLEQYASASGLVRLAKKIVDSGTESTLVGQQVTAEEIFLAAQSNDVAALLAIDCLAKFLGGALADIAAVCDPQVIVIGGGLSQAGELLCATVTRHYRSMAFGDMANTPIKIATLQNDAGIWGAAGLLLNNYPNHMAK
ncbi:ROK family glucokinase [Oscillospiraceae bacterium LTW-04]|nr:ROK family glucokinase [Oscillospiraceae bacterium MB24-C1]